MKKLNLAMLSILLPQFFIPSSESIASLVADEEHKVTALKETYTYFLKEGFKFKFTIAPETTTPDKVRIKTFGGLEMITQPNGEVRISTGGLISELTLTKKDALIFLSLFKNRTDVEIQGLNLLGF